MTVEMIGTLAAISIPVYGHYLQKAATARTIVEVRMLDSEIKEYENSYEELPKTLAQVGRGNF